MGGTQSWARCDGTFPAPDPANAAVPSGDEQASGDPIIAVIMFLATLFGLLLLTALVHCGIIAFRGLRHRHRHRRHQRMPLQPGVDCGSVGDSLPAAPSVTAVPHPSTDAANGGEGGNDGDSSSSSSSMTSSSSESSLDSTTARIAAQVASRRRQSRFMMTAADPSAGGVRGSGASPTLSWRPADVGGGGFLMPPHRPDGVYDNRGYDHRFDA